MNVESHEGEDRSSFSSSSSQRYYFGPSRLLTKRLHLQSTDGTLDFTITGGNADQPIRIASVVWSSHAYLQGMRPGDQILSVNGISFEQNINHSKALQILYSSPELDLIIRTLRINALDATLYDWYDPVQQRSTSPPPGSYLSLDAQLPYFERTVRIDVQKGKRLGLVIRGGAEYGLGMFISGVDKGSLSDQVGLCVGDQILSVNGIDFRHITHTDAVQLLRTIDQMLLLIRQINKLPKPKDQKLPLILEKKSPSMSKRTSIKEFTVTKQRTTNVIDHIVDEKNKTIYRNQLRDYLEEKIHIDQFTQSLLQILNEQNQQSRSEILLSLRKFVRANDFDRFDIQILKDDLNTLKLSHERLLQQSFSSSRLPRSSTTNHLSKSMENLRTESTKRLIRPNSLMFNGEAKNPPSTPPMEKRLTADMNSLRKAKSLHNLDQPEQYLLLNKSRTNVNDNEMKLIDEFLQDYSSPYPITVHKIRSTLGVAIEGGFHDRIPLPRIVYMQPDGCAYLSSGLRVGHVIVGLNGYSMKGLSHREAALFIASSFKDRKTSQLDLLVVEPNTNEH